MAQGTRRTAHGNIFEIGFIFSPCALGREPCAFDYKATSRK